jgi:hypothetical protein
VENDSFNNDNTEKSRKKCNFAEVHIVQLKIMRDFACKKGDYGTEQISNGSCKCGKIVLAYKEEAKTKQ